MRLWLWGIVVGLGLGMVAMDRALKHLRASSLQTWQENLRQAETLKASTWKQIEKLYMAHRSAGSRLSKADLQKQLNGGPTTAPADANEVIWMDPVSGLVVHFAFNEKGDWTGYQTNPGRAPQPKPPAPTEMEKAIAMTLYAGGLIYTLWLWVPLWVIGLFVTLMDRSYRPLAIELSALLGIVVFTGFSLNPDWPWNGGLVKQGSGSAVAILTASVIVVALIRQWLSRPRILVSSPLCDTCGYNLTGNESGVCPECGAPADFITYKRILDLTLREKRDRARLDAAKAQTNQENYPH